MAGGFMEKIATGQASDGMQERVLLGENVDDEDKCCDLDFKTRLIGFLICFGLGMFFSFFSIFSVLSIVTNPSSFAIIYSLGNILALGSTCFLWGPRTQARDMCKKGADRVIASIIYLSCIFGTIMICIFYPRWYLILPLILIQFIAGIWYTLSFFPRIRRAVLRCIGRCLCQP